MKFFNKNSIKFVLGFLSIVAVSLFLIVATSAYAYSVEDIDFVTEERAVLPSVISESITIQTQDSSGNSVQTDETIDLEFISSSPSGEFLSSTGNPVTKTMSKNTANRTFYYRDSSEGVFTLSIKATGRDSLKVWSTSQIILVSKDTSFLEGSDEQSSNLSSTGGPTTPVSNSNQSSSIEASAGSDRLTTPGSPITFKASMKKSTATIKNLHLNWSFGDGSVGEGEVVTHTYKYPGDYVVVLNVNDGSNFSTSRLKVLVTKPSVEIIPHDGYLEIKNNSNNEINLFNWKITNGYKSFIFQPDTIILPKSYIMVDDTLFTIKSSNDEGVVLKNFLGTEVAIFEDESVDNLFLRNSIASVAMSNISYQNILPKNPIRDYEYNENIDEDVVSGDALGTAVGVEDTSSIEKTDDAGLSEVIFETKEKTSFFSKALRFVMSVLY